MPLDAHLPVSSLPSIDRAALAAGSARVQSSARWFWWIAGLSVINSVVIHTGGNFNFVVGLAFTQVADGFFNAFKPAAFLLDAVAVAFFALIGHWARRGRAWAFVVGGIAYVADAAIFAFFGDWLPVAFHAYALYYIFIGAKELRDLLTAAEMKASEPPPPLAAPTLDADR